MPKKKSNKEILNELEAPIVFEQTYTIPVEAKTALTPLEEIEAEMRKISPTLSDLKHNNPARYREVYRRFMWLVGERDKLKEQS